MGLGWPGPTCQVHQALQAGGQVALRALGVAEVEGLQGCHGWELPGDHGEPQGRESVRMEQEPPQPCQTGIQTGIQPGIQPRERGRTGAERAGGGCC